MNRIGMNCSAGLAGLPAAVVAAGVTLFGSQTGTGAEISTDAAKSVQQPGIESGQNAATGNGMLEFFQKTSVSGFVSASFFHNFNESEPTANAFVRKNDEFSLNKVKLALEQPVAYNASDWDAGFRVDLIAGEDAKVIHAAGLGDADTPFDLEQAYININAPVGRGLKLSVGKMVTLMGVEVVEEPQNPNWSLGNQFLYAENVTQLGGAASYKWTDRIETTLAVFNGWDRVNDNNRSLSYCGKVGVTLNDSTTIALLGYGGPEQDSNNSDWRRGAEIILSQKIGKRVTLYVQGDYGTEDNAAFVGSAAEWIGMGLWATYDFSEMVQVALRADHFIDDGSSRTGFDSTGNASITSTTLTVNIKPFKKLHVRPEIRYDRCSETVFDNDGKLKRDQVLIGLGASYIF